MVRLPLQAVWIGFAVIATVGAAISHASAQPMGPDALAPELHHEPKTVTSERDANGVEAAESSEPQAHSFDAATAVDQPATPTAATVDTQQSTERPLPLPAPSSKPLGERTPSDGGTLSLGSGLVRTLTGLGVVLALIFGLRGVLRRAGGPLMGGRAPSGVMEVLGRFPFAKGQSLVLLKVDRRVLLLCQTSSGATTLSTFDDPEDVAALLHRVQDEDGATFHRRLEDLVRTEPNPKRRSSRSTSGTEITESAFGPAEVIDLTAAPRSRSHRRLGGVSS